MARPKELIKKELYNRPYSIFSQKGLPHTQTDDLMRAMGCRATEHVVTPSGTTCPLSKGTRRLCHGEGPLY